MWSFGSPYNDEWRGNKIERFQIHRVKDRETTPARIVDLCTSDDIVEQIKMTVAPQPCVDLTVPAERTGTYSHRLYFPDGPDLQLEPLLELLSKVLSIRIPNLDVAVAFDWYGIPPDEEHSEWRTTPLATLRKKAKFWKSSPQVMEESRRRLTTLMTGFVDRHPLYGSAQAVVATPGHDRSELSCSEDLAERLACATGKLLVMTDTQYQVRDQVKGDEPVNLAGQFSMPSSLSDLTVIVVDDVIKSGKTMRHMGVAARKAGAARVLGLAPVRTMRGS